MRLFLLLIVAVTFMGTSLASAVDHEPRLQEEVRALPLPPPTIVYVVRPMGDGPFPLAIMKHGMSLDPVQRSFFPLFEFRDAAIWSPLAGAYLERLK